MAQFDVHVNPGRAESREHTLCREVQTRRFDSMRTRIVVPLMRIPRPQDAEPRLAPELVVSDESLFLGPLSIFAAPVSALGPVVASLSADEDASRIIAAIDQVISQAFD
jgi:toxin CcdB